MPSITSPQPAAKIPAPKIGSIVIARVETEPVGRTQFGMVSIGDAQAAAGTTIDWRSVSIFEAAAGGLYIPSEAGVRPGNFVALPNQPIDSHGNIFVPYAGLIPAAGKTPTQVDQELFFKVALVEAAGSAAELPATVPVHESM